MKKVFFLMLFLLILGAANVNSQVRIGGNGVPNGAAVLDLNAADNTNDGTKGLALPRVSLANNTTQITSGTDNLNGMLVYNTNTTLGSGVYYWATDKWVKVSAQTLESKTIANRIFDLPANGFAGATLSRAACVTDLTIRNAYIGFPMCISGFYTHNADSLVLWNPTSSAIRCHLVVSCLVLE